MILVLLFAIPLFAGIMAWGAANWSARLARSISLLALLVDFGLAVQLWTSTGRLDLPWITQIDANWIPQWGVHFHLGMDGLSLLLILLTLFLGIMSVAASWREVQSRVGFFHFNLMWVLSGIIGVFLALDLFLFYFFWELMLVPMYFLIGIWGHENKTYAAIKFFLFTQASGLFMLLAILGLYFTHGSVTGQYTFDYVQLLNTRLAPSTAFWLMLGFFVAFAVKLPVIPLHTWLPDAHTEAPTAGSVILAGLLLKTGGYGLIRFVLPLFPGASRQFAPIAMGLAVAGILYGSILAFAQRDLKRLVAYSSISHLGFVLLGVFAGTRLALQGAVIQMICHGLSTGALFILVGAIQERIHTRQMDEMGGFWSIAPRMSGSGMFFALASLGLPGLGNFVGEFLTLLGTYQARPVFGILAALGFVVSTIYSLRLVQAVFHGQARDTMTAQTLPDLSLQETLMMGTIMVALVWIGVYPQPLLNTTASRLEEVQDVYR
jgi:NADH-quinone oxidoreductase subunit M